MGFGEVLFTIFRYKKVILNAKTKSLSR